MLTRDWLLNRAIISRSVKDGQLDDEILEQGKTYTNKLSSADMSEIDVHILSGIDDLKHLELINHYEVKEEQEAQESIGKLWNGTFEQLATTRDSQNNACLQTVGQWQASDCIVVWCTPCPTMPIQAQEKAAKHGHKSLMLST